MALPSANAAKNLLSYSIVNLVPLRVNVVSDDKAVTIVETMVLDRTCWPVPLFDPLEEAIQRNADELAHGLLSDLEVHGMGRTVRHFTGRVDMWSASLQNKIAQQLIPQLRHVAKTSKFRVVKRKAQVSHLLTKETNTEQEDPGSNKKQKTNDEDAKETKDDMDNNETLGKNEGFTVGDDKETATPDSPRPLQRKKSTKASLVPVRLRLCVNGVRIHDDFIWDLSIPQCPIEFAQSLGHDLNLSDEAIVAIVTSIVEQLDGSAVEDTNDLDGLTGAEAARKNATAAWRMDTKANLANMVDLLGRHRPT